MSIHQSKLVWKHSQQRGTELTAMLFLADIADHNGRGWCKPETLAEATRTSTDDHARYARVLFQRLETAGEITITKIEGTTRYFTITLQPQETAGEPVGASANGSGPSPLPTEGPEQEAAGSVDPLAPTTGSVDPVSGSVDPVFLLDPFINPSFDPEDPPIIPPQPEKSPKKTAQRGGIYRQPPTSADQEFPFQPVKNGRGPTGQADQRVKVILEVCGLQARIPTHRKEAQQAAAELADYTAEFIRRRYGPPGKDWNPAEWNWYTDDFRGRDNRQPTARWLVETIAKTVQQPAGQANGSHPSAIEAQKARVAAKLQEVQNAARLAQ